MAWDAVGATGTPPSGEFSEITSQARFAKFAIVWDFELRFPILDLFHTLEGGMAQSLVPDLFADEDRVRILDSSVE